MIECEKCGANLSLKDEFCPFCGTENPDAIEHVRMLRFYQDKYASTRDEVVSEARLKSPLRIKRIIIAVLILLFIVLSAINIWGYNIRKSWDNMRYNRSKAVVYADYVERMKNLELAAILGDTNYEEVKRDSRIHYAYYMASYYTGACDHLLGNYSGDDIKPYSDMSDAEWMASYCSCFYEMQKNMQEGNSYMSADLSDKDRELCLEYSNRLDERLDMMLMCYANLSMEDLERFKSASSAEMVIILEQAGLEKELGDNDGQ